MKNEKQKIKLNPQSTAYSIHTCQLNHKCIYLSNDDDDDAKEILR